MTSILTTQAKILAFIDISQFTDDLRLVIFDYMYARRVTYIAYDGGSYCLRLGPCIENGHCFLQINTHTENFDRVLSTFGTYCEQKAIYEYDIIRNDIISNISFDWMTCLFTKKDIEKHEIIYNLYAFCQDNQSTIMFQVEQNTVFGIMLKHYYVTECVTVFDEMSKCVTTEYYWQSGQGARHYTHIKETLEHMIAFYKNALKNGSKLNEHEVTPLYYIQPQFIKEIFNERVHMIRIHAGTH